MESLWNFEQKWKLSTQEAFLLFVCTAFAVVGLCTTAALLNKKNNNKNKRTKIREMHSIDDEPKPKPKPSVIDHGVMKGEWSDQSSAGSTGWAGSIKKALMSKVCWSGANKWEETKSGSCSWRKTAPPLLAVETISHNGLVSPVWQRPILMGERCELPRFSGLILYDEQGRSLRQSLDDIRTLQLEKPAAVVTLRDLL